jgi:DNA-binding MarR family transcriptional regulator
MSFDPLVANPGRLRILTALAVEERQEFVSLRRRTQLTDGNLAAHAKRLSSAGLIAIDKQFREGKPVTSYLLTAEGRRALESHARRLVAAISTRRTPTEPAETHAEARRVTEQPVEVTPPGPSATADEDWVD